MKNGKTISVNRKARFDYLILETLEAGIVLTGTEIKSVREGRVNLGQAFAKPDSGEMWLYNAHIAEYSHAIANDINPIRTRRLLLHKNQIRHLSVEVNQKGLTIVPLRLYLKNNLAKLELGLAKGRKQYDKRRVIMERDREREARQARMR